MPCGWLLTFIYFSSLLLILVTSQLLWADLGFAGCALGSGAGAPAPCTAPCPPPSRAATTSTCASPCLPALRFAGGRSDRMIAPATDEAVMYTNDEAAISRL
jgi:hypothetical protein